MLDTHGLTVRDHLDALRRRWWVVVAVTVAVVGVALVPVLREAPTYESGVTIRNSYSDRRLLSSDAAEVDDVSAAVLELVADLEVVASTRFRSAVAERLADAGEVADFGTISASLVPVSTVMRIRVVAEDPASAAVAAQAAAELFVERRRDDAVRPLRDAADGLNERADALDAEVDDIDERLIEPTITDVERQALRTRRSSHAAASRSARDDSVDLTLEADVRSGRIHILSDAGVNSDPVAPKPLRSAAIGLVLGVLLGTAAALLLGRQAARPD